MPCNYEPVEHGKQPVDVLQFQIVDFVDNVISHNCQQVGIKQISLRCCSQEAVKKLGNHLGKASPVLKCCVRC